MSVIGECIVAFVFGSIVGLLVQRSRFCNTAALRDAMLFKTYRNTKPLLIAMMILTFGFTLFLTFGEGKAMHFDVGLNQVAGLFLFGIGMVLAGACTVSIVSAVLSKEFYLRFPRRLGEWVMITIGGLLMGFGIRLAFVCNVSTFFGLTPQMNLGGYLAISGILAGAWVGSWIYKKVLEG